MQDRSQHPISIRTTAHGNLAPLSSTLLQVMTYSHVTGGERSGRKNMFHWMSLSKSLYFGIPTHSSNRMILALPTSRVRWGQGCENTLKSVGENREKWGIRPKEGGIIIWGVKNQKTKGVSEGMRKKPPGRPFSQLLSICVGSRFLLFPPCGPSLSGLYTGIMVGSMWMGKLTLCWKAKILVLFEISLVTAVRQWA